MVGTQTIRITIGMIWWYVWTPAVIYYWWQKTTLGCSFSFYPIRIELNIFSLFRVVVTYDVWCRSAWRMVQLAWFQSIQVCLKIGYPNNWRLIITFPCQSGHFGAPSIKQTDTNNNFWDFVIGVLNGDLPIMALILEEVLAEFYLLFID